MKRIVLLLFFALMVFSCEKVTYLSVENSDIPLLSKIKVDGKLFMDGEITIGSKTRDCGKGMDYYEIKEFKLKK